MSNGETQGVPRQEACAEQESLGRQEQGIEGPGLALREALRPTRMEYHARSEACANAADRTTRTQAQELTMGLECVDVDMAMDGKHV